MNLPHPVLNALRDAQDNFDALAKLVGLLYAPGDLKASAAVVVAGSEPTGWLLCDGRAVSRTIYAALFAAAGTQWGAGDGSTTFNLPDLRGRSPMGSGTGTGLTARTVGSLVGEERHTLVNGEMPAHNHGGWTGGMNSLSVNDVYGAGGGTDFKILTWGGAFIGNDNNKWDDLIHNHAISTDGGGAAHNTVQPSAVVSFLVKT